MSPYKPLPGCKYPYCSNKAERGSSRCRSHRIKVEDNRISSTARGYNYRWQKVRKTYLIENPLCVECLSKGIVTSATTIDHIEPHRGDYDKFWNEDNMQSLCTLCHNIKTGRGK